MVIQIEEIVDKNKWENFLATQIDANFLQSYNFGEFHKNSGKTVFRIGFSKSGELKGVMLCIVEKAKRATYLTIPGGPLIDWGSKDFINAFVEKIKSIAKAENCSFVRVRPQILETEENAKLFSSLGFKKSPMHLHAELTHQLNLNLDENTLLVNMRKTTRYEIKQAMKLGINIVESTKVEDIEEFYNLQKETAKRQGFVEFSKKFLEEQFKVFSTDNQVVLYTAFLGKIKLAQAFIIFYGREGDYHYGASTLEGRNYPGAYLIQWQAVKEAKKRGMERYNFWGVAPENEVNHRFHGVSVFKRGFGGADVEYLHARDLIINPFKYTLNWTVETLRKKIRKV